VPEGSQATGRGGGRIGDKSALRRTGRSHQRHESGGDEECRRIERGYGAEAIDAGHDPTDRRSYEA
jgi:hypothetical protein